MDNLVLIRVASTLDAQLRRSTVLALRQESTHRFRIVLERAERRIAVVFSLRPEVPWIGRPVERARRRRSGGSSFAAIASRSLKGGVVASVTKPRSDRSLRIELVGRATLVVELAPHGANAILLDPEGRVSAVLRRSPSSRERCAPGTIYSPPPLPRHLLDPFGREAGSIDAFLDGVVATGETPFEALRRKVFGVGTTGARWVIDESVASGESPGHVLAERLSRLECGAVDPVIEAPLDPAAGDVDPKTMRLLPWAPAVSTPGRRLFQAADPAATAGLYHETLDRRADAERRMTALRSLLDSEIQRLLTAEGRAEDDRRTFDDPARFRIWGEALLAGLTRARRVGEVARVPDPYDPEGGEISVPVKPGQSLEQAAAGHFARHRRASRGLQRTGRRLEELRARRRKLETLRRGIDSGGTERPDELESAMRAEGLPVGLEGTRRAREDSRMARPRLERVRMLEAGDGTPILVGRSAADNHRLTFKLAAPEDFWFHALGCTGAHVVLRNPTRRHRPPASALVEAAAVAAWYSEARRQAQVDVQWTRRKYVRRPRGAAPGTVVIKRFETIRVRPAVPGGRENE